MQIVVLDADPAFGSLSKSEQLLAPIDEQELRALGDLVVHQGSRSAQVIERCQGAEVILTNKVPLGQKEFESLPNLKLVSVLATGVNVIDLNAARANGVTVCNVPGYSTDSTAQHAIALLLELTNRVGMHESSVFNGKWSGSAAFSYYLEPLSELSGKTMGVVGFGAIGAQVAQVAQALGMRVIAHSRTKKEVTGVRFVDKEELLRESDVVSLHCPLTESTQHFIDRPALRAMKPSALLINCARGPVVDEEALADALDAREIHAAATDVLCREPPLASCRLLSMHNCIVTPHIAWATTEARTRLVAISAQNIGRFLAGSPQNVVAAPECLRS